MKIERVHERRLGILYNDKQSWFKGFLEMDSAISIHEKDLQILAVEMYKISNNFLPYNINKIFEVRNKHFCNLI